MKWAARFGPTVVAWCVPTKQQKYHTALGSVFVLTAPLHAVSQLEECVQPDLADTEDVSSLACAISGCCELSIAKVGGIGAIIVAILCCYGCYCCYSQKKKRKGQVRVLQIHCTCFDQTPQSVLFVLCVTSKQLLLRLRLQHRLRLQLWLRPRFR